jgi:hypothetical protein
MFLLPLPQLAKGSPGNASQGANVGAPKAAPTAKTQPKKKFKASKKSDKSKPEALAGMETMTKDGQNVCWAFNLQSGCQAPLISGAKVAKCAKGLHVCAFCHKPNHSQMVCNLKKRNN